MSKHQACALWGALSRSQAPGAPSRSRTMCLPAMITKTDHEPVLRQDAEGATGGGRRPGFELMTFAGQFDGDHETQVAAIETCIANGASGILH